jgi:nicotinate (nicotinamide) nucleotide adenylyltransferase
MTHALAVYGGSFNPPGEHHRRIVEMLTRHFDEVIVVPCGPRPDKQVTNDVPPVHRAAMVDMTFRGMDKVRVELFDLEAATFTRTHGLDDLFASEGEVWHVVGTDMVTGGGQARSQIQRDWEQGARIWESLRFAVLERPGFELDASDLPPRHRRFATRIGASSARIRDRVFHREEVADLVVPEVAAYIERYGLYRGMRPSQTTSLKLGTLRPLVFADPWNPEAIRLVERIEQDTSSPNVVVVVGGDGTMLRAIRKEWRRRLPFWGINTGHLGFLLNATTPDGFVDQEITLVHQPLLWVEVQGPDGGTRSALAFNDAWVERASGQTAWLRVEINAIERVPRLIGDGALVSTPAGSTSYARAMGATPLPLNTQALLLVGSNVLMPAFFRPVVLEKDTRVDLTTLDPDKRPLRGYIDGVEQGRVHRLSTRVSRIAAVELAFDPRHDLAEKLARIQFPPGEGA